MITGLHIKNFKCIKDQVLDMRPLTIVTGVNSSGKSSVLQAILLLARNCNDDNTKPMYDLVSSFSSYDAVKTRTEDTDNKNEDIFLSCSFSDTTCATMKISKRGLLISKKTQHLKNEKTLYFLSANRLGPESIAKSSGDYKVGDIGEYLFGTLSSIIVVNSAIQMASNTIIDTFIKNKKSIYMNFKKNYSIYEKFKNTIQKDLGYDIDYHRAYNNEFVNGISINTQFLLSSVLSYICDTETIITSIKMNPTSVQVLFHSNGVEYIDPRNLGASMSYLAKVLILCFLAKPDDVVMIENPEVHLHPKAQARLGEFLSLLASQGIQLIIETHCEHLINKVRYQVYKEILKPEDVIIHYKEGEKIPFKPIAIDRDGHYNDDNGNKIAFPAGFFDASLNEVLEMA